MVLAERSKTALNAVALPIMVAQMITVWILYRPRNKRLDEVNRPFDEVLARLGRIEKKLDSYARHS